MNELQYSIKQLSTNYVVNIGSGYDKLCKSMFFPVMLPSFLGLAFTVVIALEYLLKCIVLYS